MRTRTNPKEVLLEEFMKPLGMDENDIFVGLVHYRHQIIMEHYFNNKNAVVDDSVAHILSSIFKTSKEFWLNLQKNYDESRGE